MRRLALLFSILAIAMLAGCGEQAEDATRPADDTEEATLAEVTIINGLELWDIYYVYVDPSDEDWGDDRLGDDEILEPGESFTVTVETGTWDIQVIDEDYDSYTLWQVDIGPDGLTWTVTLDDLDSGWDDGYDLSTEPRVIETGEGSASVSIINDLGGWDIYYVYVDPSDAEWGEDRLGMDILYGGDELIVHVEPGIYDIRIQDEDADTYTLWGVELDADGFEWYVTLSDLDSDFDYVEVDPVEGDAAVTIVNDLGGWDIYYIYVDPSNAPWGEDRLGASILDAGESFTVWVDPGIYDIRVQDEDEDTYTLWEVEVGADGYEWHVTLADIDY